MLHQKTENKKNVQIKYSMAVLKVTQFLLQQTEHIMTIVARPLELYYKD